MRTTMRRNNRPIMDTLLLMILFSGCISNISGETIKNAPTHNVFKTLAKSTNPELDKVFTGIVELGHDYESLVKEPILSHRYRSIKAKMELKLLQLQTAADKLKATVSGERLEKIAKMQNELESSKNDLFQQLGASEAEQKRLNDANVQIVITQLQQEKLDEAVATFANITDHDLQIERIVVSAFGNGDNFENFYRFLLRLPGVSRDNGFKALHEQLKKNQIVDHRIWILADVIVQMPVKDSTFVDSVLAEVRSIVRNKNYDGLYAFLNKHGFGGLEAIRYFARLFVVTVYEEADNGIENFFSVVDKMTFTRHRLYLINELILMLKASNNMHGEDMSRIVFEFIKLRSAKKPQNKFFEQLIEANLPDELRDLMYDELCIRNVENDEYLFASAPAGENQRHIHTAKTQTLNESFYWQVYFIENGTKLLIKNSKYGEHLFLLDEGNDDDEHVLRSWMPSSLMGDRKAEFYLNMLGMGQFAIVNKHYGQVVYSPFEGEPNEFGNRPVFSKKYDPKNIEVDSKWIIGLCKNDVKYVF